MKLLTIKPVHSIFRIWLVSLLACVPAFAQHMDAQAAGKDHDLTVHEWGTFTSVAGNDGRAVEWAPLSGAWPSYSAAETVNDLPAFVEHFGYIGFKVGLRGTVRMETPVIYFYSPRNLDVSVHVSFSKGLITEWYPHPSRISPTANPVSSSLYKNNADGAISWDLVHVEPGLAPDFAREGTESHYYGARETSASPVRVQSPQGDQHEKFLFYRGVSAFSVPVSARLTANGKLQVTNLHDQEIPAVILFERRGEKVGYLISNHFQKEALLEPPELTAGIDSLYSDLEQILEAGGLFQDEAHAMIRTWQNSWFEEGSRLFYIVPRSFVDTILPLTIHPAPQNTARVFVGRLELVTPATQEAVEKALVSHDAKAMRTYNRFLEPILKIITEKDPVKAKHMRKLMNSPWE